MQIFKLKFKTGKKILALGAELDSSFAYYVNGQAVISSNTKDTANNPVLLEKKIETFYRDASQSASATPDCILTDFNPEYNTTKIGAKLAQKLNIPHIKIQHHTAHIFAVITEYYLSERSATAKMPDQFIGIACDGTGYGTDGAIWGGEVLLVKNQKSILNLIQDKNQLFKIKNINRVGHLEEQTLIGGQLAIEEPARMLMAILAKFLNEQQTRKIINKFYTAKICQLLHAQLKQNFNCQNTSSCARVLDAASALLFGCNERKIKHQAVKILEKNSSKPYTDIKPSIIMANKMLILPTTPLFEYLIKNLDRDKKRLSATVHSYIANGLFDIAKRQRIKNKKNQIIFSGGMANNKIFRKYFKKKNVLLNQNIEPGDYGISLGQIGLYLLTNPRN